MNSPSLTVIALGLILLTSCGRKPPAATAPLASSQTNVQVFMVNGVVKEVAEDLKSVSIQHEEIPNFMLAMTMPFSVRDTNELRAAKPGEKISFRLHVTPDESWIDQIKNQSVLQTNQAPAREPVRVVREVEPLNVGDMMPDHRFTNELGRAVSLSDFKGSAIALTFIFTRCPLPEFCPLMSRNFSAVQKKLASTPGAPANWHLLSISFDPHFDTPEVLRKYAQLFRSSPDRWNFVTGAMIDIDAITEQFGLVVVKQGESFEHKLRTAVIDAAGKVQKVFLGNQWTADELVAEITKAAHATATK